MRTFMSASYLQMEDMIYYTIGQDPNVKVGHVVICTEDEAEICIYTRYLDQAEALRSVMPEVYEWGMKRLCTKIFCGEQQITTCYCTKHNQRSVASLFCRALTTNPLFVGVSLNEQPFLPIKSSINVYIYPCLLPIRCNGQHESEQSSVQTFAQVLKREFGGILSTEILYVSDAVRRKNGHCLYCVGRYGE